MKPINVDFVAGKSLSDYGLENSDLKRAEFEGNVLKLEANEKIGGELIISLSDSFFDEELKIKVKNAKGDAFSGPSKLINNEYVDTKAVRPAPSAVVILLEPKELFEMSGFSIIPR